VLKLHLDTDIGGDIDDLCALVMLLNWPDVDICAVTTNSDDRGRRAGYARYVLDLAGRQDVAVAAGADVSSGYYRIWPGLPDETIYWPQPVPPHPNALDEALTLLERSVEQGALILAIGAFTNLALLEKRSPGILQNAKVFLMGGYVFPPRPGFPAWDHKMDWNVQVDIQSAQLVLQQSTPTLVPISVTVETALRRTYLPSLRKSGPLAQLIARQAEAFAMEEKMEERFGRTCPGLPEDILNFLHDPLACAIASGWNEGVESIEILLKTEIEDGWLVQRVDDTGKLTRVVTRIEGNKFSEFWLDTVLRKPHNR
jgi:purine nucleosidase